MTAWLNPRMGHPCYSGEFFAHSYTDGVCQDCGAFDPDHEPEEHTDA